MKTIFLFLLISWFSFANFLFAEEKIYTNKIYKPYIKTVLLYPNGKENLIPIINLATNDYLTLRFDDLQTDVADYAYRIIHCTLYWKASNLNEFYYLDGFNNNPFYDFEYSINTLTPYIQYELDFPNENVVLKLSGNYIIQVYNSNDEEDIIFEKKFYVLNKMVDIKGNVVNATNLRYINTHQELEFKINYNPEKMLNPSSNMKVFITQNNRFDNTLREVTPQYYRNNELIFDYKNDITKTSFRAGYEFRFFNTTNLLIPSINVKETYKNEGNINIMLQPDKVRKKKNNFYQNDINGNFLIGAKDRTDKHLESEYLWVTFSLLYDVNLIKKKVFVAGKFNDWQYNDSNQMQYNEKIKGYTATILLKQGFYNYLYIAQDDKKKLDNSFFDGSNYETENSYTILVYHYNIDHNIYELVGNKVLNSTSHK